ncbi:hypothetical protein, partial [Streptococcus pneumoniae]|uniref:hypothetical protein n=1 Tax=Streptococcus pneumoniae TaxID=1313 RepID=UPI000B096FE9
KASKSELTQTAEELSSKIASVQVGGRNYIRGTKRMMLARGLWASGTFRPSGAGTAKTIDVSDSPVTGFDKAIRLTSSNARDQIGIAQDGFYISQGTYTMSCWVKGRRGQKVKLQTYWQVHDNSGISPIFTLKDENWTKLSFTSARNRAGVASIGYVYLVNAEVGEYLDVLAPQLEDGSLATSSKEAPEDIEGQISTVESTFKQRANSLDAGVRSLTEGLRTKVDISALNVTAENIRQSVKSLETDTQNKLNQKLSQAEFEVRAGSIRQEILNATKDKASKSELTQTAEELSSKIASVQVGGINLLRNTASLLIGDRSKGCWMSASGGNGRAISVEVLDPPKKMIKNMIRVIENTNGGNKDLTQLVRLRIGEKYTISCYARIASDSPNANVNLLFRSWANNTDLNRKFQKSISHKNWQKYSFTFTADAIENSIQFGQSGAGIIEICAPKIESGTLATDYSEAPEDIEGQISTVESTFKQRANSLEAGVNRLTEGLRTKADISSLNVTAENIRQSVKSLETDTQNKLNQKLSQAEFEVRAGSIRQEILNATKNKASKSELTQTAEELSSKIASVQASGRNLFLNSLFKQDIPKTGIWTTSTYTATIDSESKYLGYNALKIIGLNPSGRDGGNPKVTYPALGQFGKVIPGSTTNQDVTISFYAKANKNGIMLRSRLGNIGYKTGNVTLSTEIKRYVVHIPKGWTNESKQTTNEWLFNFNQEGTIWIWMPKFEISDVDTSYSEAPEDIEGQISTVESTFKQRANSLDAGVRSLTEGLRTKVDISALNVTAENIRQSVKSLETDTQNKLNQKLSQAEFEVRAGSIRQEILNATKNKASKSELTQTAEELSSKIASVHLGRRNLLKGTKELARYKPVSEYNGFKVIRTVAGATRYQDSYVERTVIPTAGTEYIAIFYARASENDYPVRCHFYNPNTVVSSENSSGYKSRSSDGLSIIRLSTDWQLCWVKWSQTATDQAKTVIIGRHGPQVGGKEGVWVEICAPAIFEGNLAGDWSPAYEDQDERVSAVESNFKQRADSLEAGVSRLTEGLRTKADISSLNVTAENIRQSVKSLETDTQNKLNQKLSQAEFEVRAGSIRQEILNATKNKADKTLVVSEAGKLREEFSKMKVGGRNLWIKSKTVGAVIEKLPENHVTGQK